MANPPSPTYIIGALEKIANFADCAIYRWVALWMYFLVLLIVMKSIWSGVLEY